MTAPEPSQRGVIRLLIRCDHPKRHIVTKTLLDTAARAFSRAICIQENAEHHLRVIGGAAPSTRARPPITWGNSPDRPDPTEEVRHAIPNRPLPHPYRTRRRHLGTRRPRAIDRLSETNANELWHDEIPPLRRHRRQIGRLRDRRCVLRLRRVQGPPAGIAFEDLQLRRFPRSPHNSSGSLPVRFDFAFMIGRGRHEKRRTPSFAPRETCDQHWRFAALRSLRTKDVGELRERLGAGSSS